MELRPEPEPVLTIEEALALAVEKYKLDPSLPGAMSPEEAQECLNSYLQAFFNGEVS